MADSKESAYPGWLGRLFRSAAVRRGEEKLVLAAASYFFYLLMSYYLLRPLREVFGISSGADKLPIIWSCTLGVMALISPLYSAIVSWVPRRVFIPGAYYCFGAMILAFGMLYRLLPDHGGACLGFTFYVWLSVFNLFVVSIFWSFMSDLFSPESGQRLFGTIAIGGTLGAMAGASFTAGFSRAFPEAQFQWLFFLSAAALLMAAFLVLALFHLGGGRVRGEGGEQNIPGNPGHPCSRSGLPTGGGDAEKASREPGPSAVAGFALLGRSALLRAISLYMLLYALTGTFLYVFQGHVVASAFASTAERALAFARMDFWTNALTLATQLFLTHRLVARLGIPITMAILPILTTLGFGALWAWPGFASLAIFQVARRGLHYGIDRPAREMLYIPLSPDARYKAKSFIDTFVYRAGDFVGVWITPMLEAMSLTVGLPGAAMSAVWVGVSRWLGEFSAGGRRDEGPKAGN